MTITPAGFAVFGAMAVCGWGAWWLVSGIKRQVYQPPKKLDPLLQGFMLIVLFHMLTLFLLGILIVGAFIVLGIGMAASLVPVPALESEGLFGALSGVFGLAIILSILGFCLSGAFLLATGRDMSRWRSVGEIAGYDIIVPVMMAWFLAGMGFVLYWHYAGIKQQEMGGLIIAGFSAVAVGFGLISYVSARIRAYRDLN